MFHSIVEFLIEMIETRTFLSLLLFVSGLVTKK